MYFVANSRCEYYAETKERRDPPTGRMGLRQGLRRQSLFHRSQLEEDDVDRPAGQVNLKKKNRKQTNPETTVAVHTSNICFRWGDEKRETRAAIVLQICIPFSSRQK